MSDTAPKQDPLDRSDLAIIVTWTLVATLLYLFRIDTHSLWLDEVMTLDVASRSWAEQWRFFQSMPEQHPLYYLLLGPWLELGTSEFWLRGFSVPWALASGWLLYLLGRRLFGRQIAAIAIGLLLVSPFWLHYAQEARMYTLLGFLTLSSHILFLRWRATKGRGALAGYLAVGVLGMYTHLFFLLVPAAHLAFAIWDSRSLRTPAVRHQVLAAVGIYAAYLPWAAVILLNMPDGQSWKGAKQVVLALPYTLFRFSVGYSELIRVADWKSDLAALLVDHGMLIAGILLVFGAVLTAGCVRASRRGTAGRFVLASLFVPVIGMYLLSIVTVVVGERYLLVSYPTFILALALGVHEFTAGRKGKRFACGALLVALLLAASGKSLARYYTDELYGKEEWRTATQLVAQRARAGDKILFHTDEIAPAFRYYYDQTAEEGGGAPEVLRPGQPLGKGSRLWILVSHEPAESQCAETLQQLAGTSDTSVLLHRNYAKGAGIDVFLISPGHAHGRPTGSEDPATFRYIIRECPSEETETGDS